MEEIKVSEMLQADSIEKDNAVMIIQDGVNKKASGSIQTATGTSLSLTSVADTCKVKSNSKNMFDEKIEQGGFNNSGLPQDNATRVRSSNFTKVNANTTYTVSVPSNMKVIALFYDTSMSKIGETEGWVNITRTFTTPANTSYLKLLIGKQNDSNVTPSEVSNVQLEKGSTATSYNPYNTEVEICGKNLIDSSLFIQGDFSLSNTTTRLVIGQKLYLRAGTYTISTNLNTSIYRYYINTLEGQIGSTYGSQKYNSNWQTSSSFTFTLSSSQEGYFAFVVGKIDGSTLLAQEMASYNFQLENGDTATTYEKFEGQYLDLTPDETKTAFTYDTETIVEANGSVTIEYNTQSRLLNNDDVLDIVEPVKEYVDKKSQEIYSTEETKIGTWINEKPLYRKVYKTEYNNTTAYQVAEPSNVDTYTMLRIIQKDSSDYSVIEQYYYNPPNNVAEYLRVYRTNGYINVRTTKTGRYTHYIIAEYTKTTD